MKSTRASLILGYDERQEVENGVFENKITEKKVKAEQERIYQSRQDQAMQEGNIITARFRIRSNLIQPKIKYAIFKGNKYKIRSIDENIEAHYGIIELGQLI